MTLAGTNPSYVLITPARNEERSIERTIRSVVSQTLLPLKWVIVSDASTDTTDEIVKRYLPLHPWIELVRMPEKRERSFAAKVGCFNAGYAKVQSLPFEVVGNLDADVSFDETYMQFLLTKFCALSDLGVAGTPFEEDGYSSVSDSFEGGKHVAGGCQMFRRKCFEEIGGYIPNREGGIDWIAVTTARMKGWKTVSFKDKVFFHHRRLGTGNHSALAALFTYGKKDYYLGNHPVWEMFRLLYRIAKKPYVIGSCALFAGYLWGVISRMKRPVSAELMQFHRKEELAKLKRILLSVMRLDPIDKYGSQA